MNDDKVLSNLATRDFYHIYIHQVAALSITYARVIHITFATPFWTRAGRRISAVNPFLAKFCSKVTHPLLTWASETFGAIAAEWLEIEQSHTHNEELIENRHRSRVLATCLFPIMGLLMHTSDVTFRQITLARVCKCQKETMHYNN